jgi:competence protein ComEC
MRALLCLLFCCSFILGSLRFDLKDVRQPKTILDTELETTISLSARVVSEPEYHPGHQRFVVEGTEEEEKYKILVSTDRYPEFYYGDVVTVSGTLRKPENFITESGREFDYVQYLAKDEIYYSISFADIELVEGGEEKGFRSFLFSIKNSFLSAIARIIPEPESSLLGGILFGAKQSLGEETEQNFIDTGTIHIVVLSGYNVTIVSEAIVRNLEALLPKQLALSFGGFGIVLFALMSGATTTTIRAGVMGLLGLLARMTGRTYDIVRALCLAAFLMVLWNPYVLMFDISFQLSFIATLGLVVVTPLVEKWKFVRWCTPRFGIREILASTLATQIAVLPFLVYKIGTLSIIAPLANILVLPLIPLSMGVGFLASLVEALAHLGSTPISWISYGLLHYTIQVVDFLASFSWSAVMLPPLHILIVIFLYGLIGYWVIKNKVIQKK